MKFVFCANCGTRLLVTRKAMPKFGCVLDLIEQHTCAEEFIPPDLTPVATPTFIKKTETTKFANHLDELQPPPVPFNLNETGLRDKRDDKDVRSDIVSSAPTNLLEALKRQTE